MTNITISIKLLRGISFFAIALFASCLMANEDPSSEEIQIAECLTETAALEACFKLVQPMLYLPDFSKGFVETPRNKVAKQVLRNNCDIGHALSCEHLARQLTLFERTIFQIADPDPNSAHMRDGQNLWRRACTLNSAYACVEVAQFLMTHFNTKENKAEALDFLTEACDLGEGYGCLLLGEALEQNREVDAAWQAYEKSCNLEYGGGCYYLGHILLDKTESEIETQQALTLYQQACDFTDGFACFNLATFYESGTHVKKDLKSALYYYGQACEFVSDIGCDEFDALSEVLQ